MTRIPSSKKKIGTHYYSLMRSYHYKSDAYVYAKRLRAMGYQVRVFKRSKDIAGRQWMVYGR